jgi:hypothetical protein
MVGICIDGNCALKQIMKLHNYSVVVVAVITIQMGATE